MNAFQRVIVGGVKVKELTFRQLLKYVTHASKNHTHRILEHVRLHTGTYTVTYFTTSTYTRVRLSEQNGLRDIWILQSM